MLSLTVDMVQHDCPFIDTTTDHDVSFSGAHWDFDTRRRQLEAHVVAVGEDRGALANGLAALREHPNTGGYRLLSRTDDTAVFRVDAAQTAAMRTVREHDGYLTGSFEARNGHEVWRVGFDLETDADRALAALERENEYTVMSRERVAHDELTDLLRNAGAVSTLIEACRGLTATERETLEAAVERGYFESPREDTLGDLAEAFGVSKTAVSQNLRRAERKTLSRLVDALDRLDRE
jgi:predicted DNA binding protein